MSFVESLTLRDTTFSRVIVENTSCSIGICMRKSNFKYFMFDSFCAFWNSYNADSNALLKHDIWLYSGATRYILSKWSKNYYFFFKLRKRSKNINFSHKNQVFLILDIILRIWVNFHKKGSYKDKFCYYNKHSLPIF